MTTITTRGADVEHVDPAELRAKREAAGLTQRELARAAECSLSWVANAEGGYVPRTSPTLDRVLAVLGGDPENDSDPAANGAAAQESPRTRRHDAG